MKSFKWKLGLLLAASALVISGCGGEGDGGDPVNHAPEAFSQNVTTDEDVAKTITLKGTDEDSDTLTYAITASPAHGTLSGTAPDLLYTPAANYNGTDSFKFKVYDGTVNSAEATVSLTLGAVNDVPTGNAQTVAADTNFAKTILLTGTDIDGDALTYSIGDAPEHGSLSCSGAQCRYTPTADYAGTDHFTFKVNDGSLDSSPVDVNITVTARPFQITVKTDNPDGFSADNAFTISTDDDHGLYTYDYTVECGDGSAAVNGITGDHTCTYDNPGTYTISIHGHFPRIIFQSPSFGSARSDNTKLLQIDDWGTGRWQTMEKAFYYCSNVTLSATRPPNLTEVTSLEKMFYRATSFDGAIGSWDISHITTMQKMFYRAESFDQDISDWNVSNVTDMESVFDHAYAFNQDIGRWDVSHVTDMEEMFADAKHFNQDIGEWNVSLVLDMEEMFAGATAFDQDISTWDIRRVLDMDDILEDSNFSQVHYNQLLCKWSRLPVQNEVYFGVGSDLNCSGTAAAAARKDLIQNRKWHITDGWSRIDTDDDGATDDEEWRAGTNTTDPDELVFGGKVYKGIASPTTPEKWLDRNLGADRICQEINDTQCYGAYYQWGRKNGSSSLTTTSQYSSVTTSGSWFVKESSDWASVDSDGTDRVANWSKTDGTFTCPKHYRVPTIAEWDAETDAGETTTEVFTKFLKLPRAGYKKNEDATITWTDSYTMLWSTDATADKAKARVFSSSAKMTKEHDRADGIPVRCIHE